MPIRLKRVYEEPSPEDGYRVLVERLWPRGVSKEQAALDEWIREAAPSPRLRQWYGHDKARWTDFKRRYLEELEGQKDDLAPLIERSRSQVVTFVYASREERYNSASVLREYFERR